MLDLAISNGGKRLGMIGKVVDNVNKASDSLTPAEKRTYKQAKKSKKEKYAKLEDNGDDPSFAEVFEPQMAYFESAKRMS
jgi:hypothetical protein